MKKMLILLAAGFVFQDGGAKAQDPGMELQLPMNNDSIQPGALVANYLRTAILASNQLYGEAFQKNDSLLFIDRYDVNAWIMPPNSAPLMGPSAAGSFFTVAYHQMQIRNVLLNTKEIYQQGSFATEVGSFQLHGVDNKIIDRGKYVVLWKFSEGQWKMYRDCFNSDLK